jgi:energy-converting hydrogenase Eha subunit A
LAFDVWYLSGYAAAFAVIGIITGLIFGDPVFIGERVEKIRYKKLF